MSVDAIKKLNVKERIILMNEIWDSLNDEEEHSIKSPDWHESVLKDRMNKIDNNDVKYISLEELKTI